MEVITHLPQNPSVSHILNGLPDRIPALVDLAITIQQIPAPTFAEAERASFVQARFEALGLADVHQDSLHNVYGCWRGKNGSEPVIVSAHLDTVFAAATDLTVKREAHLVHGPGIGDNSVAVAGLIMLAEMVQGLGTRPRRDIWFVANVCEEGMGDLQGMKGVVAKFGRNAAAYIVLEGGVYGNIFHQAIAVRRYRIDINTPGGHSWGNFGNTSAIHVLGHLIAAIDQIRVPSRPRTTFNVGLIEGGTTINSIAAQASLLLDCRSEDNQALADLLAQVHKAVDHIATRADVRIDIVPIGDRPAGTISPTHWLVRLAEAALHQSGCAKVHFSSGSTDANIPLSQGLPAICIGLAQSYHAHRQDEYLDTTDLLAGMKQLFLLTLAISEFG